MKRCKFITCWTDYPFAEFGDVPGEPAPIRRVWVLCYDGDKYATVQHLYSGTIEHIKVGYLYRKPERSSGTYTPKTINPRKLERMIPQIID